MTFYLSSVCTWYAMEPYPLIDYLPRVKATRSIVGTKVLERELCLKEFAQAVTHVSSNTLTESESNFMLSVNRNPDEFKHMRRCTYFSIFGLLQTWMHGNFLYLSGGSFDFLGLMKSLIFFSINQWEFIYCKYSDQPLMQYTISITPENIIQWYWSI